jgi:capsular polysaccharide transport system permease protein
VPAGQARFKARHAVLLASFLAVVVLPMLVSAWYLWTRALDQYASHVGFTVRTAESEPAMEFLGGITELSGSSTTDAEIIFEFVHSENLLRTVREDLDLEAIWSRPGDPIFTLSEDSRIEALQRYWRRMVKVFYDSATGLIEVRVNAFDPVDAQAIASHIYEESSRTINELSAIARDDSTRYAREELDRAVERLKEARASLTAFRNRTQIVDPQADALGRIGLLNTLQTQLAAALIDADLVRSTAPEGDPRVVQAERRVEVIQERIRQERAEVSDSSTDEESYSSLVGEFEALAVDRQFAEQAYLTALAGYDSAVAEAQRKSLYLAAYITPTRAETPLYPQRWVLLSLVAGSAFILWSLLAMAFYALRDRR